MAGHGQRRGGGTAGGDPARLEQASQMPPGVALGIALATEAVCQGLEVCGKKGEWLIQRVVNLMYPLLCMNIQRKWYKKDRKSVV